MRDKILKENTLTLHIDSGIPKNTDMQQDGLMTCPHLREWHIACCVVGDYGFVLMPFMRKTYCRSANFHNCPFWEFTEGMTDQAIAEDIAPSRPTEIF